jgi:MFS family permease
MVNVNTSTAAPAPSYSTAPASTNVAAMAMVTTLFFFWGFVTVLNDILVPHLKSIFDLNYAKVMLIQFAFFSAYFIFSIPSARLVDAIGYKKTMVTGLFTMGVGALLFIPAASAASFPLFLVALMTLAAGITALQVAANPYVAVLGPPETASSRLNLTQAFNSLGTTIGPYLGGLLILNANFKGTGETRQMTPDVLQAYRVLEASSVKLPYLVIGVALIIFGIVIAMFKLPDIPGAARHAGTGVKASLWKYRQLVFGAIGIFVYVGAEVSIGSFLINYFGQPEIGSHLLLGRRHGGPLHRLRHSAESKNRYGARRCGHDRLHIGLHLHAEYWTRGHVEHHCCRSFQFHYVPQHFYTGDCRTRPVDRRWLRNVGDGHRRRRDIAGPGGRSGGSYRNPPRFHHPRGLLSLYSVLRTVGLAADPGCYPGSGGCPVIVVQ